MSNEEIMDRLDSLSEQISQINKTVNSKTEEKEQKKNDIDWPWTILNWLCWLNIIWFIWTLINGVLGFYREGETEASAICGVMGILVVLWFKDFTKMVVPAVRLSDSQQVDKDKRKAERKRRKELKKQGKIGKMQAYLEKNGYSVRKEEKDNN